MIASIGGRTRGPLQICHGLRATRSSSELVSRMPNDRRRRRAARRVKTSSRLRAAPVLFLGLVAVALFGRTPSGEAPLRWTVRDANTWMSEWDGVRDVRLAAAAAAVHIAANQTPMTLDGAPVVVESKTPEPPRVVAANPVVVEVKPVVVAEADLPGDRDLPPRDVPKQVPLDAPEPLVTGSVPAAATVAPAEGPRVQPTINRTGKTDRLFAPAPIGRSTEQEIFTRPTLAVVPPSQEGWPPVASFASLVAPASARDLPRSAIEPIADDAGQPVVVAMVRTGPGRVVTQSAIAALGSRERAPKGRIALPPVPEAEVAAASPRSQVWAQPDVPALGYVRTNDVEYRFKSLLGDEDDQTTPSATPDDQLPP